MPLHGIKELRGQFKALKRETGRNLSRRVARLGAGLVRDEARKRAPVGSGRKVTTKKGGLRTVHAREGILSVEGRSEVRTDAIFRVGFRKTPKDKSAFYLRFIERGTKPHVISVVKERGRKVKVVFRNKRVLRTKAGEFLGIAVFHPGIAARPFLVPALHAKEKEIVQKAQFLIDEALRAGAQGRSISGGSNATD